MLAFRLTRRKDNVNSGRGPRSGWQCVRVSEGRHHHYHHWHCYYCGCPRSLCVCERGGVCSLRNGKSNIFAYEMSEKSKHGGSRATKENSFALTARYPA